jgi:hypothetical protein
MNVENIYEETLTVSTNVHRVSSVRITPLNDMGSNGFSRRLIIKGERGNEYEVTLFSDRAGALTVGNCPE